MTEARGPEAALLLVLCRVLGRVLGRDIAIDDYSPLSGGIGERTYRVTAGGQRYVVRLAQTVRGKVLDLDAETDLMRIVAAAGLAPAVAGADAEAGALVTHYLAEAKPWTAEMSRTPRNIGRAAALLRKLHELQPPVRPFEPVSFARAYLGEARDRTRFDAGDERLARELLDLATDYERSFDNEVLCHNDLVAANILDTGELALVDFEYAVCAAPVLDLASLAAMNGFDARRRRALVDAYYPAGRAPFSDDEFGSVARMVRLLSYFWALAQDDGERKRYGAFAERRALERAPPYRD
ncbi:phosphotransferase [Candidatus Rariloculus sp.]|uniref:phosphotransferase n=1 Tax=Candidatus Rariloculus sp. TaxID=3101265 RepID=UPI003D0A1269